MKIQVKIKHDRFSAKGGESSKVLDIVCRRCNNIVLVYQKDGQGPLLRCYLDRIIYPETYKKLRRFRSVRGVPRLSCNDCDAIMGKPVRYWSTTGQAHRLAFKMIQPSFKKRASTQVRIK